MGMIAGLAGAVLFVVGICRRRGILLMRLIWVGFRVRSICVMRIRGIRLIPVMRCVCVDIGMGSFILDLMIEGKDELMAKCQGRDGHCTSHLKFVIESRGLSRIILILGAIT